MTSLGEVAVLESARRKITVGLVDLTRSERVRMLLRRWFRESAEAVCGEVFDTWAVRAERQGIKAGSYRF